VVRLSNCKAIAHLFETKISLDGYSKIELHVEMGTPRCSLDHLRLIRISTMNVHMCSLLGAARITAPSTPPLILLLSTPPTVLPLSGLPSALQQATRCSVFRILLALACDPIDHMCRSTARNYIDSTWTIRLATRAVSTSKGMGPNALLIPLVAVNRRVVLINRR
jgi:hypothetical protein